jgi:hypothetical protein
MIIPKAECLAQISSVFSWAARNSRLCDGQARNHLISNDVRRLRLISITHISLLPCHGSILFMDLPDPSVCIASWKGDQRDRSSLNPRSRSARSCFITAT